jgi:CubicO group peptidase (beta-lactamase class C family)
LWSSALDLLTWLDALSSDRLGPELTRLVQRPGRLDDGTALDYAWGVTARSGSEGTSYTHGGKWPGWSAKTVRRPATGTAVVLLTTSDDVPAVSRAALELHDLLQP